MTRKELKNLIREELNHFELKVGIAVEMEHTNNPKEAKKIAIDHLKEDPNYYTKLYKAGLVDEPNAKKLANKYFFKNENILKESYDINKLIKYLERNINNIKEAIENKNLTEKRMNYYIKEIIFSLKNIKKQL